MRRQGGGHYGSDSGGGGGGGGGRGDGRGHHTYGGSSGQMHHQSHNSKSRYYQERHQEQQNLGEKEGGRQDNNQWRWVRDDAQDKLPQTAMSPTAPFSEGREAPRSYYQNQRVDPHMPSDRQGAGGDLRPQSHEEDMEIGYEDNLAIPTFEGLEQRFLDDIKKLSKEQNDAEDSENARHREKINAINKQYEEQLFALRAQHATRRDEFLRRESQARQQQYQQMVMEQFPTNNNNNSEPSDPRGYNPVAPPTGEPQPYDSYRERSRFPGNARDHGYEFKVPFPKGRAYGSGSRYY